MSFSRSISYIIHSEVSIIFTTLPSHSKCEPCADSLLFVLTAVPTSLKHSHWLTFLTNMIVKQLLQLKLWSISYRTVLAAGCCVGKRGSDCDVSNRNKGKI